MVRLVPPELMPADVAEGDLVYVLDRDLRLTHASASWTEFARDNGGERLLRDDWNRDALAGFRGSALLRWKSTYAALLSGRVPSHEEDFTCPSPTHRRRYRLRVTAHRDAAGAVVGLVHHAAWLGATSTVDPQPHETAISDRQQLVMSYRARVLDRAVTPAGFDAAQYVAPLEVAGGDLLWHHVRSDGTTDVVVADVMGHGLRAAGLAITLCTLLDDTADAEHDVAFQVSSLNRSLADLGASPGGSTRPAFATGLYMRLDPQQAALDICSFGHTGPIFSEAGRIRLEHGLPVGIDADGQWLQARLRFAEVGARFVVFSDGMTEQFNPDGELFGEARFERVFLDAHNLTLPQLIDRLQAEVDTFRASALIKDDRVLLAVERRP